MKVQPRTGCLRPRIHYSRARPQVPAAFVGKVMSLLFNRLSRLVTAFLPRSKHRLISWLQSPFAAMILVTYQKKKSLQKTGIKFTGICSVYGKKVSLGKKLVFISLGQPKVLKILYQSR